MFNPDDKNLGWVKLHRKIIESQVWQDANLLKVWIWCLAKATHKERWASIKVGRGETQVKLLPGQFIYGRKKAGKELMMKPESVRYRINKLVSMRNLTIKPTTHYSVVSVCNWGLYQDKREDDSQPDSQPSTNHPPTIHQPTTTDNKDKNVENEENEEKAPPETTLEQAAKLASFYRVWTDRQSGKLEWDTAEFHDILAGKEYEFTYSQWREKIKDLEQGKPIGKVAALVEKQVKIADKPKKMFMPGTPDPNYKPEEPQPLGS